jgi:DNA-directed RNA polymerases I, II, and III subunit RPABC2
MRNVEVNDTKSLTKYEKARMIGSRALQISLGAPILINLTKLKLKEIKYNPVEIAKLEFVEGKIPIMVRRPLP